MINRQQMFFLLAGVTVLTFGVIVGVRVLILKPSGDKEGQVVLQAGPYTAERVIESFDPKKNSDYKTSIVNTKEKNTFVIDRAKLLINKGQFLGAVKLLDEIITHAPFDPRPYSLLALSYVRLGEESKAVKILEKGTDVNTDYDFIFKEFIQGFSYTNNDIDLVPSDRVWVTTFKDNKMAAVSYIFDDGEKSVYTHALPIFDQYGFKATLNLVPGEIEGNELAGTWEQWQDAHKRGYEIGNHTMHHLVLRGLTDDALEYEINESFKIITEKIGESPVTFIFPFERFSFDEHAVRKVMERHQAIIDHNFVEQVYPAVFHPTFGGKYFSAQTAKEITKFAVRRKLWLIAQCHGVALPDQKTYKPVTADFLREHLLYIKENEKDIWMDTFKNVYSYFFQKKNVTIVVDNISNQAIEFNIQTNFNSKVYTVPLTIGVNPMTEKFGKVSATQNGQPLDVRIDKNLLFLDVQPVNSHVRVEF